MNFCTAVLYLPRKSVQEYLPNAEILPKTVYQWYCFELLTNRNKKSKP